jgi:hypothetical protein
MGGEGGMEGMEEMMKALMGSFEGMDQVCDCVDAIRTSYSTPL